MTIRTMHGAIEGALASPRFKAAISATTNAASTAVSANTVYMLQATANVYVHAGTSTTTITKADGTTATLTAALGYLLEPNEKYILTTRGDETSIAAITGSSTSTVNVFTME